MSAELSLFAPVPPHTSKTMRIAESPRKPQPVAAPAVDAAAPPGDDAHTSPTPPPAPQPYLSVEPVALEIEEGKLLLTEREAAKALSVCPRTLWQLRTDGEIPCIRFGRAVRYDPSDLRAWVARNRR